MTAVDDEYLLRLAEEELLGEARRAAARHSTAGPSGWQPVPKANKPFLVNTLLQALSGNRALDRKRGGAGRSRERKLLLRTVDRSTGSFGDNMLYRKPRRKDGEEGCEERREDNGGEDKVGVKRKSGDKVGKRTCGDGSRKKTDARHA